MPQSNRVDVIELKTRLEIIKEMIADHMPQAKIVQRCLDEYKHWDVTTRQIYKYIRAARRQLAGNAPKLNVDERYILAVMVNDKIIYNNLGKNDKVALSANVANINLLGLDDPHLKKTWADKFKSAGLDPQTTMDTFTAILKAEAEKLDNRD